jgi:ATP phosphoribosyltransferase regulatory subunit
LYVQNKEFLVSDGIITFTDTDGKLLALKPDVTLSILKNAEENTKVFYDENVYRISGETKQYKEIRQVGLERIGNVSVYDLYETMYLAVQSLCAVSERFVLDISHLGIISAILEGLATNERFNKTFMRLLAEKNAHSILALCEEYGLKKEQTEKLVALVRTYGDMRTVLEKIAPFCIEHSVETVYILLDAIDEAIDTLTDLIARGISYIGDKLSDFWDWLTS